MSVGGWDALHVRPGAVDASALVASASEQLLARDLPTAPHVTAQLIRRLSGDLPTVLDIAEALTPDQRSGHRMLPRLLPLSPAASARLDALRLEDADFFALLVAALCLDDQLDLLLAASGREADEVSSGVLGQHLNISHGRFAFADDRLAIWLEHSATDVDSTRAHNRLQQAYRQRGDRLQEDWHRARGALQRTPSIVAPLISAGRELAESGHTGWGFDLAAEAADHAVGSEADEARLVAGLAALGTGCMDDAADWLGSLFPSGELEHRTQALGGLLIAELGARGLVPSRGPREHRPRTGESSHWRAWARTTGLAAVVCAERAEIHAMRGWLAELRDADAHAKAAGSIRDCAVSLCWTLTGEVDAPQPTPAGSFASSISSALQAAVHDDLDHGLQLIARAKAHLRRERDPLVAGFDHTPLIEAYLAVTDVLLHFWRGDVGKARERLLLAAADLPIGIPFAGLGATLAQRLDIAVLGTESALTRSLVHTLPAGSRIDRLVSGALEAYLAGDSELAAMQLNLWHDRGAPEHPLGVPGLDEVGPVVERVCTEPRELGAARSLRRRIRSLPESAWRRECADIADAARQVRSPFARGRVEAMLGSANVIRGDARAGRRFLRAARRLFDDAGADAWRNAVDERLGRLRTQMEENAQITTVPIAIIRDKDPLEASRVAWAPLLTRRELDVAMRVVEGASNRQIADELQVSVRTVEVHLGRVFSKLGVRRRVELTVLAHRTARHL